MSDHVDLLAIAGIEHTTFYNSGEDINLVRANDSNPHARVFRKGGKVVYRSGAAVMWDEEDSRPHTH